MRGIIFIAAVLGLASGAFAESALDAVKQLPAGQSAHIAKIEGRDGAPDPERWYILTQDPTADNGVHEFVVSYGQIVASRSLSQFAGSLKPADVLGDLPLIDSVKAAQLAEDYAAANGDTVATLNYDLKKDATTGVAVWTVSCLDATGAKLGSIIVTAGKGTVVSHDGFAIEPTPSPSPSPVADIKEPGSETDATPDGADTPPIHHHHHPSPSPTPKGIVGKTFDTVGHTLQKLLPF